MATNPKVTAAEEVRGGDILYEPTDGSLGMGVYEVTEGGEPVYAPFFRGDKPKANDDVRRQAARQAFKLAQSALLEKKAQAYSKPFKEWQDKRPNNTEEEQAYQAHDDRRLMEAGPDEEYDDVNAQLFGTGKHTPDTITKDGKELTYMHMSDIDAREGSRVRVGEDGRIRDMLGELKGRQLFYRSKPGGALIYTRMPSTIAQNEEQRVIQKANLDEIDNYMRERGSILNAEELEYIKALAMQHATAGED